MFSGRLRSVDVMSAEELAGNGQSRKMIIAIFVQNPAYSITHYVTTLSSVVIFWHMPEILQNV